MAVSIAELTYGVVEVPWLLGPRAVPNLELATSAVALGLHGTGTADVQLAFMLAKLACDFLEQACTGRHHLAFGELLQPAVGVSGAGCGPGLAELHDAELAGSGAGVLVDPLQFGFQLLDDLHGQVIGLALLLALAARGPPGEALEALAHGDAGGWIC